MSTYVTCTEASALIRAELKKRGWTSKHVSVRSDQYSSGSSIRVEIKDPGVPLSAVKATAEAQEHVRRDGFGEILSGGNRFVSVEYSQAAKEIHGRRWADAVQRAVNRFPEGGSNALFEVEGTPFLVGCPKAYDGKRITLWRDGYICEAYDVENIARQIGALMNESA